MELDGILENYNKSTPLQKNELKRKLRELWDPKTSQTSEQSYPNRLKGRPKGSLNKQIIEFKSTKRDPSLCEHVLMEEKQCTQKVAEKMDVSQNASKRFFQRTLKEMPSYISKYIIDSIDMVCDGHCGYRAISHALNMGDNWIQVRTDLSEEIIKNEALYDQIVGVVRQLDIASSLLCYVTLAPVAKWMSIPDIGLVAASCYNVSLVSSSKYQSFTFIPLHSAPLKDRKMIYIGFVNGDHFIRLVIKDECPLPPIFSPWLRYHEEIAAN